MEIISILDSGILYRRIALLISEKKITLNQVSTIKNNFFSESISLRNHKKLRSEEISKIASKIAIFDLLEKKLINCNEKLSKIILIREDLWLMEGILAQLFLKMQT